MDLLGLTRDAVMPPLSQPERVGVRLTEVGFLLINWGNATIHSMLAILRLGARIDYEDGAIALTEAPDTVRGFVQQRFR